MVKYHIPLKEKYVSVSGIKETRVFNEINNFHVINNRAIDPQHDLQDGVLRYNVPMVLYQLIFEDKLFTLDELN